MYISLLIYFDLFDNVWYQKVPIIIFQRIISKFHVDSFKTLDARALEIVFFIELVYAD